jgi:hypothetical protein
MDRREMVGLIGSLGFGLVLTGRTWADGRAGGNKGPRPASGNAAGRPKSPNGHDKPTRRK